VVIQRIEEAIRERDAASGKIVCKGHRAVPTPPHALLLGAGKASRVYHDMMRRADE
jgi:hypothetical protein